MPTPPFNDFFNNLSGQGKRFNNQISPNGWYYAFMSKLDYDPKNQTYDVFFELMPQAWADNSVLAGIIDIRIPAPTPPATVYHILAAPEAELIKRLGLTSKEQLAEGSWYEIQIAKSSKAEDSVVGGFYDPDIDKDRTAQPPDFT